MNIPKPNVQQIHGREKKKLPLYCIFPEVNCGGWGVKISGNLNRYNIFFGKATIIIRDVAYWSLKRSVAYL